MLDVIPVIDLFAGPGGLNEGFAASRGYEKDFSVRLSIESDNAAHRTLELRSFFRQLAKKTVPEEYYDYLRGQILREELFEKFPAAAGAAADIAWHAVLGEEPFENVTKRIRSALPEDTSHWVLLGGPPCQAYSTMGRSRMRGFGGFDNDHRHLLYREYMKIVAAFNPTVFVMENVKGLLSSMHQDQLIFGQMLADMRDPWASLSTADKRQVPRPTMSHGYRIYSFTKPVVGEEELSPTDYVIEAEHFGIPQRRHRVILLGIRSDYDVAPEPLEPAGSLVSVGDVIGSMPKIRSSLSRNAGPDNADNWAKHVRGVLRCGCFPEIDDVDVKRKIRAAVKVATRRQSNGRHFIKGKFRPDQLSSWLYDPRLGGVVQHQSKSHMASDLHRYMFASSYAAVKKRSPRLIDFPPSLLPNHSNAKAHLRRTNEDKPAFNDRFRVQLRAKPATTVTAHLKKDGHYFIHPDPTQCRALTQREAARLQTFPDNYFFEGSTGSQLQQIGNAVPPFLAFQLADIVAEVIEKCCEIDFRIEPNSNVKYISSG